MSTRTKKARASAPLRFATEDAVDEDNDADDNMADIITIMQEFQKKKAMKSTSRANAMQNKKNAIVTKVTQDADTVIREGSAYFEQVRTKIDNLQVQEVKADSTLRDVVTLWSAHEQSIRSLLSIFPTIIEDLSPRRAKDIDAASEMIETHPKAREASRRRIMRNAKKGYQAGLEEQKLATDSTALIKHYKALLFA